MNNWTSIYLAVFLAGAASTLILTPFFRRLAVLSGFMDLPAANHKGHRKATPLLGGAALFTGWIGCLALGVTALRFGWIPGGAELLDRHLEGFAAVSGRLFCIVLGAALAVLLGLWDDRRPMGAAAKFAGQFAVALIAVLLGGVRIKLFGGSPWLNTGITLFWFMLLMNSINFFDNMDGLAVGTVSIAMGCFTAIAALNEQYFIAVLSALSCGVGCGFWFYNANPASIFMGDSGSHFLGYLAAVISSGVTFFDRSYSLSRFPMLMPLFILALPLFDTVMVVAIRTRNRKPFWIGDHNHISHRFVRMGLDRKQAVMLVHLMALSIGLGILPVFWGDFRTAAILVAQSLLLLAIITMLQFSLSKTPDARETVEETMPPPEAEAGKRKLRTNGAPDDAEEEIPAPESAPPRK